MLVRSFFTFCFFFYGGFAFATTYQEYQEAIKTQENKDNRKAAEEEFGSQGGIHLDGSGSSVHTDSQYYKDKAKRLGEEIELLDSQLAVKKAKLNWLKTHCRPNKATDCGTAAIEVAIQDLKAKRGDLVAEKSRAEHNQSKTAQLEKTTQEAQQTIADAQESAKKKAEKQKKLLYLTAAINAAAGAYLLKTKCNTHIHYGCYLGPVALAQAGLTMKRAGEMGKTGEQFSGMDFGSFDPPGCDQYSSLCDVDLPTDGSPPSFTGSCPDGMPGNVNGECTFTISDSDLATSNNSPTLPAGPGAFTFSSNNTPTVTATPIEGGNPWTLPQPPEGSFSMNDPEIQSTLAGLKKEQAPLYGDAKTLAKELGGSAADGSSPLAALGDSGLGADGSAIDELLGAENDPRNISDGKFKKGTSSFAGGGSDVGDEVIDEDDSSSGRRGPASPYRNLLSQFNKKRKMPRDLVGEKAVTFGEDKIGVTEDNIFLMVHRAYEKHREEGEFIEEATRL